MAAVAKICPGCGDRALGARCERCTKADDRRRHDRQRLHGRDSESWRRLCQYAKARDGHRCVQCGSNKSLTVHLDPARGGDHETARLVDVVTLCSSCHGSTDAPRSQRGGVAQPNGVSPAPRQPSAHFGRRRKSKRRSLSEDQLRVRVATHVGEVGRVGLALLEAARR